MYKRLAVSIFPLLLAIYAYYDMGHFLEKAHQGIRPGIFAYLDFVPYGYLVILIHMLLVILIICAVAGIFDSFSKKSSLSKISRLFSISLGGLAILELIFGNILLSSLFLLSSGLINRVKNI